MALAVFLLSACAHFELEDCPGNVLGKDVARLRTSHYRVELKSTGNAAARFLPYALMSAYAYRDGTICHSSDAENPLPADAAQALLTLLAQHDDGGEWKLVPDLGLKDGCEDERGMMFHVWERRSGSTLDVVIAFRGTNGFRDWIYGNLWWFTRVYDDNQLTRARRHAGRIIAHYKAREPAGTVRFFTTGHSLGGSLAQHALYAYPDDVVQAVVFDPSSVTGFAAVAREQQLKGCQCPQGRGPEARIVRIYESYEVLANLRIFHKIFFPPERHVQEVRFPFRRTWNAVAAHSMSELASGMARAARERTDGEPWYASKDATCTAKLVEAQRISCAASVRPDALLVCPQ